MKIGVIGCGFISSALIRAIAADGHGITVSERNRTHSTNLANHFESVAIADNQTVLNNSDIIILGLLADVAPDVLAPLGFRSDHRIISLMAGLSPQQVAKMTAPAAEITLAIPFPFVGQKDAPILVYPQSDTVKALLGTRNRLFVLENEVQFNAYMSAQAVLSPLLKMLEQTSNWMVQQGVDASDADGFLLTLIAGSLNARPPAEKQPFTTMLQELNTKGGLNAQLREYLLDAGLNEMLVEGLEQLNDRLTEK